MRRLGATLAAAAAAALLTAPTALAGYFPGQTVDGPSADIDSVGGVALARDGGGQVVYLKRDAGVSHVFVALLSTGDPRQPQRVDTGQFGPSTEARIGVSDGGRAVAVWRNAGSLWGALRPDAASAWSEPQLIFGGGANSIPTDPSLSMSAHGAGYVVFTAGGDVRSARLSDSTWTTIPDPLDIDPARQAGQADVSASADGTAVAAFTERGADGVGHVYVRRIVRTRLSMVPQEVAVSADSPSVDVQDDSSYAWVTFRQNVDGGSQVLARRLVGSTLENPVTLTGTIAAPAVPSFDMTGKGRGLAATSEQGEGPAFGAPLNSGDKWGGGAQLSEPSASPARAVAAISENARGTIAWQQDPGLGGAPTVVARYWNARFWSDPITISLPDFGPTDASRGLFASGDQGGNQAIAFVQGSGTSRRVVVAVYDKEPRTTGGSNRNTWSRDRRPSLRWSRIEDSWGGIRYQVDVDGIPQTTIPGTSWKIPTDLPDGAHVWNVVALDSRGQGTLGPERSIRVDTTPPTVRLDGGRGKRGRPAPIVLNATDGLAIDGSGVASVTITFGDGTRSALAVPRIGLIEDQRIGHHYARKGNYTVRTVVKDKVGNQSIAKTQVRVTN